MARPSSLTIDRELHASVRRPADDAGLSGRHRIRDHPPGQGDAAASGASISTPRATRRSRRWCSPGASSKPPRPRSRRPQTQVNAAEIALNGVREEARVGQRTTLDVLNAQQELVNARVVAGDRPARPCRRLLCAAGGGRAAVAAGAGSCRADLRSEGALSPGARHLGRACARPTANSDGPQFVWTGRRAAEWREATRGAGAALQKCPRWPLAHSASKTRRAGGASKRA